uniref:Ovule protein n=1 Tax=Strongyloides papillosus TaxID=174720 RepID=A0A0N5BKF1_STREA
LSQHILHSSDHMKNFHVLYSSCIIIVCFKLKLKKYVHQLLWIPLQYLNEYLNGKTKNFVYYTSNISFFKMKIA